MSRSRPVRFFFIRHAVVRREELAALYGARDVAVCEASLIRERSRLAALARRLPQPARWLISPLSRTRRTAEAIFAAGYPPAPLTVAPALIEQSLGAWEGMPSTALSALFGRAPDRFWPIPADARPPAGESMADVIARVGAFLTRLKTHHGGEDVVAITHGGVIRATLAHVLGISAEQAQNISIANLSLTHFEWHPQGWWVGGINLEPPP
jgi:alpha-ribazole phosphatase